MSYDPAYMYHLRTKNVVQDIEAIKRLTVGCQSLLEVGSGTGRILFSLNHIDRRCGVELNDDFVMFSKKNNAMPQTVSIYGENFLDAEISETYDVVLLAFNVMAEFLEIENRMALLAKCATLLTEKGRIIIINSMHDFASWAVAEKIFNFNLDDEEAARSWSCRIECARDLVQQISRCNVTYVSEENRVFDRYTSALITRNELLFMYKAAKLNVLEEYGSYELEPLSPESKVLIHVLQSNNFAA